MPWASRRAEPAVRFTSSWIHMVLSRRRRRCIVFLLSLSLPSSRTLPALYFSFFISSPRSLCQSPFLSFSSSLYFLPLSFSLARSLARFSRNNLISVVVRSFYFGVFSDPFRLVWQLMQPIFRLVSFYPAGLSLINMQILFVQRFSARKDRRLASLSARV